MTVKTVYSGAEEIKDKQSRESFAAALRRAAELIESGSKIDGDLSISIDYHFEQVPLTQMIQSRPSGAGYITVQGLMYVSFEPKDKESP